MEIQYTINTIFTKAMLDEVQEIGGVPAAIAHFSQQIAGAKDFFKTKLSDYSVLQGLIGGNKLVATYGKFGEKTGDRQEGLTLLLRDKEALEDKLNEILSE